MKQGGNWLKFSVLAVFVFVSLFVLLSRFRRNPIPPPANVKPVTTSSGAEFHLGPVVLENVTRQYGLFDIQPTFGAAAYDADQDGWPDLLISNHGHPPVVFLNLEGRSFKKSAILDVPGSDRHAPVLADYDNDGDEDLLFMHGAHRGTGLGPKELYQNPGKGQPFVLVKNSGVEDPKGRGRGAIWFDYDNDGFVDLLEVNQFRPDGPNRFFHNNGDGTFTDVSERSGLKVSMSSEGGAVAGDIDNDGDMDILITSRDRPYLFINQGNGTFRDETAARGVPMLPGSSSASMADYDNDGFLDIYISRGMERRTDGAQLSAHRLTFMQVVTSPHDPVDILTFYAPPNAVLNFALPSDNRKLSDETFVGSKGTNPGLDFKCGPQNISADGVPAQWRADGSRKGLFIWRDPTTNMWTIASAAGQDAFSSDGLVTTDSNLERLDTSKMEHSNTAMPNQLLHNLGNGKFIDLAASAGVADPSNSRSPIWVDLDNDGNLDLFVVNAGFAGSGKQPNVCYINEGGVFKSYEIPMDPDEKLGRGDGGLVADFNRDGKEDLFIVNGFGLFHAGPYQLFLNRTRNQNHWINLQLVGGGKNFTNRDAIGAKVKLQYADGKANWRFVLGGSGSSCQSDRMVHFGLGSNTSIAAEVYWPPSVKYPQGHQQSFRFQGAQLDKTYVVDENKGIQK